MDLLKFAKSKGYRGTKDIPHKYLQNYYDLEFSPLQQSEIKLIEIGVRDASSLKLWGSYFKNAKIFGIDIVNILSHTKYGKIDVQYSDLKNTTFIKGDAYSDLIVDQFKDSSIDYIIDDGPHTINSQITLIKKYWKKLKTSGKIIIEDVGCDELTNNPKPDQCIHMIEMCAKDYSFSFKCYDLRKKGNHFSILIELTKK